MGMTGISTRCYRIVPCCGVARTTGRSRLRNVALRTSQAAPIAEDSNEGAPHAAPLRPSRAAWSSVRAVLLLLLLIFVQVFAVLTEIAAVGARVFHVLAEVPPICPQVAPVSAQILCVFVEILPV